MRLTRVGSLLLTAGLVVGVAASVGLILGFEPARLPPALLNIAAYKLTFAAAGGLLAVGAMLVRYARRTAVRDADAEVHAREATALGEGQSPFGERRPSERVRPAPAPRNDRLE